jgi:hypothetical protein
MGINWFSVDYEGGNISKKKDLDRAIQALKWWRYRDLNPGPHGYEPCALNQLSYTALFDYLV